MRTAILVSVFCLASAWTAAQRAPAVAPPNPCAAPEQRQLEFWVGEWDLTWPGEKCGSRAWDEHDPARFGDVRRAGEFFG
jgi:hypothetical protein